MLLLHVFKPQHDQGQRQTSPRAMRAFILNMTVIQVNIYIETSHESTSLRAKLLTYFWNVSYTILRMVLLSAGVMVVPA